MEELLLTNYGSSLVQNNVKIDGFCLFSSRNITVNTEDLSGLEPLLDDEYAIGIQYNSNLNDICQIKVCDNRHITWEARSIVFYVLDNNVKKAVCFYQTANNDTYLLKKTIYTDLYVFLTFYCNNFVNGLSFNEILICNRVSTGNVDGYCHIFYDNDCVQPLGAIYLKSDIDSILSNNYYTAEEADLKFLTSSDISDKVDRSELSSYVTLSSAQQITGIKTFAGINTIIKGNLILGQSASVTSVEPNLSKYVNIGSSSKKFKEIHSESINSESLETNIVSIDNTKFSLKKDYTNVNTSKFEISGIDSFIAPSSNAGSYLINISNSDSYSIMWFGGGMYYNSSSTPCGYLLGITNDTILVGNDVKDNHTTNMNVVNLKIRNCKVDLVGNVTTTVDQIKIGTVDITATPTNIATYTISVDGNISPLYNSVYTLGSSNYKFANVYADKFNGLATKATNDSDGNAINSTYARYIRTLNYSGTSTSYVPSSPQYDNTPTMLGLINASSEIKYYIGLGGIIANTLRGFGVIGYGTTLSSLDRYTSNGVGCIRFLRMTRAANASAISQGALLSGATLNHCSMIATSTTGYLAISSAGSSASGTWSNLSYIPAQGTSSGYVVILALRVA